MITITSKTVNADGSVTLTGTGGPVASWVVTSNGRTVNVGSGDPGAIADSFTHVIPSLQPGTYTITVTGPGKENSQDVIVTIPGSGSGSGGFSGVGSSSGPRPLLVAGSGVGFGSGVGNGSGVGTGAAG